MYQIFLFVGAFIFLLGLILWQAPWILSWFGNLPGDINIVKTGYRIYIPLTSMLIISVLLGFIFSCIK